MELFEAINSRVSAGRLTEPGPTPEQLQKLVAVAARAPDHGRLKPWRVIIVNGAQRVHTGMTVTPPPTRGAPACRI